MTPSPAQQAVLDQCVANERDFPKTYKRRHIFVSAKAGSGKSTLLTMIIAHCARYSLSCGVTMFNKVVATGMKEKVKSLGINMQSLRVDTAHSFGYAAFRNFRRGKRFQVEVGKCKLIYRDLFRNHREAYKVERQVMHLVSQAKQRGLGIEAIDPRAKEHGIGPTNPMWEQIINHFRVELEGVDLNFEWIIDAASQTLALSNKQHEIIDFDDQLYLPLLLNALFDTYDYLLVDEAQDSNAVRREIFRRSLAPGGCLIVVGDPHQAIYGFAGADNDSLHIFQREFDMLEFPLNICFRCDRAIIKMAQQWVPEIEARPDAAEGLIHRGEYSSFIARLDRLRLGGDDAILCRKNAPLMRLCFILMRKQIGCRFEGRDIGIQFVNFLKQLEQGTLRSVQQNLIEFQRYENMKLRAKGDDAAADLMNDKCAAMESLVTYATTQGWNVHKLESFIQGMFADSENPETPKDVVVLSSVHKAKGKEWDRVFLLGRAQFMPSPFTKTDWEAQQEKNLIYVAVTRAKHQLLEVTNIPE